MRRVFCRPRRLGAAGLGFLLAVLASPCAGEIVNPLNDVEAVWIASGGDTKEYFLVSPENPAQLPLEGPGTLRVYFRAHYPEKSKAATTVTAVLSGIKVAHPDVRVSVKRSASSTYDDPRGGQPSGGGKVTWSIPKGKHVGEISARASTGQPVYAIFYYDRKEPSGKRAIGPFGVSGTVYIGFVYDDNPIHYSDEDIEVFRKGEDPDKFEIVTYDDLIFNPSVSVDLTFPVSGFAKQAQFRVKYNGWQYTSNHVKDNESFLFLLRQPVRKSDYLELSYQYAPEQYIRNFKWRYPYAPRSTTPLEYTRFNYTRNEVIFGYRWRINPTWALKGTVRRALKFYNRPFMDNDLWVWAYRLEADIRLSARWRASVRYQMDAADSRGHDTVEENKENSNDSVSDHYMDRYQFVLSFRAPKSWDERWYLPDRIDWDVDYELSWYTSEKQLDDDPRHVGRKDDKKAFELTLYYPFIGRTRMEIGYKYSQRRVDSPYEGEIIAEEKDYTSNRMYIGFENPF